MGPTPSVCPSRNRFWLKNGGKSTNCLSGRTDLSGSTASTGGCRGREAGFLLKSTHTVRAAGCCRQTKAPVVSVPALGTEQLKNRSRGKPPGWPSSSTVPPCGAANRAAGCASGAHSSAIACRQGSVLPLCHLWPRTPPEWEIRIAFKFSGKSLWYLKPLKLALQNLSESTCFSLLHFGAFSVEKLCPECSLETSNGNTYYMKQGFPNRSCFGYCLLQQRLLLAGMAAGALGVSCGQGSWQRWWLPALCTSTAPLPIPPPAPQPLVNPLPALGCQS